jgi:hypothetical protein
MVKVMQKGATIMPQVYCKTEKVVCGPVVQNKRRGMLTYGVVFLHVNARLHTAAHNSALVAHFYWELFDHLP